MRHPNEEAIVMQWVLLLWTCGVWIIEWPCSSSLQFERHLSQSRGSRSREEHFAAKLQEFAEQTLRTEEARPGCFSVKFMEPPPSVKGWGKVSNQEDCKRWVSLGFGEDGKVHAPDATFRTQFHLDSPCAFLCRRFSKCFFFKVMCMWELGLYM